ncbi:aldo/keto reductase [Streptomyces sp. SID10362]|uniref:aldo/keto reductase n=1 Tax=Streptomyces sp. SID10362 TaxID=2706021 RepID=UPI0013C9E4A1|nr:aldo/keto reductase [Streptomyces sp. SID10362]NDZ71459.1 aldo/keto reductase [Streptomyces sp. SID10362]
MEYRRLGASGPVVSRVAFGNSLTAGNQLDDRTAAACVRAALDAGITTFDTADAYAGGRAEEHLGRALVGVDRDAVVICTKVGRGGGPGPGALSRTRIAESLDASLRRLGTGHVDLYQAHLYDDSTPLEETMSAFADAVAAGKVRHVGVSEWAADEIERAAALARDLGIELVSNQPQYSMLWRVIEAEVVPACASLGVGQMVWSPLAGGVLTGKYRPGRQPPAGSRAVAAQGGDVSIRRYRFLSDEVLTAVDRVAGLAAEAGLPLPRLALAWVLHNARVDTAVIGASAPEQIARNLAAVDTVLDPELLARVDAALGPVVVTDPELTLSRMLRARAADPSHAPLREVTQ